MLAHAPCFASARVPGLVGGKSVSGHVLPRLRSAPLGEGPVDIDTLLDKIRPSPYH
jgi:hypothetical protein